MRKKIFISYCWKNESIVNDIDISFAKDGVELIRDKRETEYKDSFKEFMKKIRSMDSVLMIISDAYLKSRNCMYEVLETLKDENYKERIYPIIIPDAELYSPAKRLKYLDYWKNEYSTLKEALSNYSPEEVISVTNDLKILRDINGSIVDFISIISDLKNIPLEVLRKNDYKEIKQKLGLQIISRIKIRYDLLDQEDISHAGAKRYSARILIDSKYSRKEVKEVINEVTENLFNSNYYRNKQIKNHFGNKKADVIWLFIASRLSDVNNSNWICITSWINPDLNENMRPLDMQGNDSIGEIKIEWNDKYQELSEFYDDFLITKDKYLDQHDNLILRNAKIIKPLIFCFNDELRNNGSFKSVIKYTNDYEKLVNKIYNEANNIHLAPNDCKELDKLTQSYFAHSHNLFLYYSKKGLETWNADNRIYLIKQDINQLNELSDKIKNERSRVEYTNTSEYFNRKNIALY
ncbi:MAG: toll/interleukin-1 receptor domain-containing protein [Candidatus Cloacimonetes bacterium]|nr:toll/interleukin-1 receptor domain-containing protein [Candidatus Cloacimonadota bacterium]